MEKAKSIIEFADNFDPSQPLGKEDSDAYVPIYDDILAKLCDRIVYDKLPSRTLFVAGQSGTGKTTALNFLPDKEIEKKYFVKTINFRDLIDLSDIDIIDVLLMIGFELVKGSDLEGKYYEKLENIRKIHKGVLTQETTNDRTRKASTGVETEASASTGFFDFFNLKAAFFASYRLEKSYRDTAREAFELSKPELLKTINELIEDYCRQIIGGKDLLLIIDDLDKLKEEKQIKAVFIENRYYILELKAKKVISIPIHLTTATEITSLDVDIPVFCLRLKTNPMEQLPAEDEKQLINKNKSLLHQIVSGRTKEKAELIDTDAIEHAAITSGGIIRQFMQILNGAAVDVRRLKGNKINLSDVENACQTLRKTFERPIINTRKITFLDTIRSNHIAGDDPENNDSIAALLGNQIIAYSNGAAWFEVNPLIEKTVELYAAKARKDDG